MIAYQSAASVALVLWAISGSARPRGAVHDVEGRTAFRRMLRARSRRRPASRRRSGALAGAFPGGRAGLLLLGYLLNVTWLGLVAYAVSWYALPAFAELLSTGMAPGLLGVGTNAGVGGSGQARLDFNSYPRLATGVIDFIYILVVAGVAAENIVIERERDTWSGLIATPLTGKEILRAKMIGSVLKTGYSASCCSPSGRPDCSPGRCIRWGSWPRPSGWRYRAGSWPPWGSMRRCGAGSEPGHEPGTRAAIAHRGAVPPADRDAGDAERRPGRPHVAVPDVDLAALLRGCPRRAPFGSVPPARVDRAEGTPGAGSSGGLAGQSRRPGHRGDAAVGGSVPGSSIGRSDGRSR